PCRRPPGRWPGPAGSCRPMPRPASNRTCSAGVRHEHRCRLHAGLSGAAIAVIGGLSLLGTGLLARSEAATAADLAALAGADALASAHGDPCAVAAETASRNDAALSGCELRDWDVLVTVQVEA